MPCGVRGTKLSTLARDRGCGDLRRISELTFHGFVFEVVAVELGHELRVGGTPLLCQRVLPGGKTGLLPPPTECQRLSLPHRNHKRQPPHDPRIGSVYSTAHNPRTFSRGLRRGRSGCWRRSPSAFGALFPRGGPVQDPVLTASVYCPREGNACQRGYCRLEATASQRVRPPRTHRQRLPIPQ